MELWDDTPLMEMPTPHAKQQESRKKLYRTPHLKVYGDIFVLTGTGDTLGAVNDHNSGTNKTS